MSDSSEEINNYMNEIYNTTTAVNITETKINSVTTNKPSHLQSVPESELTEGRRNFRKWLGKAFRVEISDGRVLIGFFNCTDKDANVVLSMCTEYLEDEKDARVLGNVMIPGKHIVSISVDMKAGDASKMSRLMMSNTKVSDYI